VLKVGAKVFCLLPAAQCGLICGGCRVRKNRSSREAGLAVFESLRTGPGKVLMEQVAPLCPPLFNRLMAELADCALCLPAGSAHNNKRKDRCVTRNKNPVEVLPSPKRGVECFGDPKEIECDSSFLTKGCRDTQQPGATIETNGAATNAQ
jgi:hypothetical protein